MAADPGASGAGGGRYIFCIAGNRDAYLCQSFAYIYIKNGGHYYYCAPNFNRVSVYAAVLCERVSLGSVKE